MPKQKTQHVDSPAAVGERLRQAREGARLSQAGLADGECSAAYVSHIEMGARTPSLQLLRQFARRLGVSTEYLATGETDGEETIAQIQAAELALRLDHLDEARRLYERALALGQPHTRVEALFGLGQLAHREARHRDAIDLISDGLAQGAVDPVDRPSVAETLARAYAEVGEIAQSIALLTRCVECYAQSSDALLLIRFSSMLGYALTDSGDIHGAERVVARALNAGRDVADPYARARLYWSQSRLLLVQGNSAMAEQYARKTLETLRVTEDTYAIAHALETLAHIYLDLGRVSEALALLDEGEPLIEASGTRTDLAHFRLERARALSALGRKEEAAALAMAIAGELQDVMPTSQGRSYSLLANVFRELGDDSRAAELFELAIECLEAQAPSRYLIGAYRGLADVLKHQGHRDEAFELLERALALQDRIGVVGAPAD